MRILAKWRAALVSKGKTEAPAMIDSSYRARSSSFGRSIGFTRTSPSVMAEVKSASPRSLKRW